MKKIAMQDPIDRRRRTLGQMMTELKARLGFVTQGVGSKLIDPILKSFLQEGHDYVFEKLGRPTAKARTTITLANGSKLYDFHNDIDDDDIPPESVLDLAVYETPNSIVRLRQGISEAMRADDITRDVPHRWDVLNGQIELWPTPDDDYPLVVIYERGKSRFERDEDRPCVPDRLVFLYALASAKAHYGHQDAQTAGSIFQTYLREAMSDRLFNKRFSVRTVHPDTRYFVRRTANDEYVL